MKEINIAKDFSKTPVGRYKNDGPHSGENFREKFLRKPIENKETIKIIIDGTAGYPSSFLEEAFGGLVRKGYSDAKTLSSLLIIESKDPEYHRYRYAIWRYIKDAK